jgi:4-hydroxy-2-oxoheptanedioate aldolase
MLFVGPNDLCSSMGLSPLNHPNEPRVQEAIARVLKAAHDAGKYAGMFCVSPEQVLQRAEQGFDFMNLGADIVAVGSWNAQALSAVKAIR